MAAAASLRSDSASEIIGLLYGEKSNVVDYEALDFYNFRKSKDYWVKEDVWWLRYGKTRSFA